MNIFIPKNDVEDENFIRYLIKLIPILLSSKLSVGKVLAFDKKVDELNLYKNKFDTKYLLTAGAKTLTYSKEQDGYRIYIKPNFYVVKYEQNLDKLCDFITYGNTQIKGYQVFLEVQKDILFNLSKYLTYMKFPSFRQGMLI